MSQSEWRNAQSAKGLCPPLLSFSDPTLTLATRGNVIASLAGTLITESAIERGKKMPHVAESVHAYDRQGNPVYEVPSADGKKMIPPDIRHFRKFNLLPGFSAVEKVMAAPGLERWKRRQAVLA